MANVTLSIDDSLLQAARVRAVGIERLDVIERTLEERVLRARGGEELRAPRLERARLGPDELERGAGDHGARILPCRSLQGGRSPPFG